MYVHHVTFFAPKNSVTQNLSKMKLKFFSIASISPKIPSHGTKIKLELKVCYRELQGFSTIRT